MIKPITVHFETNRATDALQKLAQAAIARPELAQGIAKLSDQLFECYSDYEDFAQSNPHELKIAIVPSSTFLAFLRSIRIADSSPSPTGSVAPPFSEIQNS